MIRMTTMRNREDIERAAKRHPIKTEQLQLEVLLDIRHLLMMLAEATVEVNWGEHRAIRAVVQE